jgi:hypothetical protein
VFLLFTLCFIAILYLFCSPCYQQTRTTMTGIVHTSDVAADLDLLPFPGDVGEDGKPRAQSFSL